MISMWDNSALSTNIQDHFMSYKPSLMAKSSLASSSVNKKERSSLLSTSITELSQEFQLHSLQPQPLVLSTKDSLKTPPSRPTYLARKRSSTMQKANQKRQQRPSPIRRQSSSAKVSRLIALAHGIENSGYDALPDSMLKDQSTPPPLQIQQSSPSAHVDPLPISSLNPSQREFESQGIISGAHYDRAGEGPRHLDSGETPAGQRLVQKNIRLRTKWRGNTSGH